MRFTITWAVLLAIASPVVAQHYRAVDGDTISIGPEDLRIIDLDTPETKFAACTAERSRSLRAQRRLQDLLNAGPVSIARQLVTRGPNKGKLKLDKSKRTLGVVRVGGRDVTGILISEQLGVYYSGRGRRIDWCRRLGVRP